MTASTSNTALVAASATWEIENFYGEATRRVGSGLTREEFSREAPASRTPSPTFSSEAPASKTPSPIFSRGAPGSRTPSPIFNSEAPSLSPSTASSSTAVSLPSRTPSGSRTATKQLSYITKHREEIRQFLAEIGDERLKEALPVELQVSARRCNELFHKSLSDPSPENVRNSLEALIDLHESSLDYMHDTKNLRFYTPLFLKRIDRLDRLSEPRRPGLYMKISRLIVSAPVPLATSTLVPTSGDTSNTSYFVHESPAHRKRLMLFKPAIGEKRCGAGLQKGRGYLRQIAAYVIDRANGGQMQVPLSTLAIGEGLGIGSLQIFRKTRAELERLSETDKARISDEDVQMQGLFRLRFYDQDSHLGNFLCKPAGDRIIIVPIDFDNSLAAMRTQDESESCSLDQFSEYRALPAMNIPLTDNVRNYLRTLNPRADASVLRELGFTAQEIALFTSTTIAMQLMSRMGFIAGEMYDFLNHTNFKSMIPSLATVEDAELIPEIEKRLNALVPDFRATIDRHVHDAMQALSKPVAPGESSNPPGIALDCLTKVRGFSRAAALQIARELIRTFPESDEARRVFSIFPRLRHRA